MDENSPRAGPRAVDRPPPSRYSLWRSLLSALTWIYAVAIVALCAWMYRDGDRQWLATVFLFGPRWMCALPMGPLAILSAFFGRRLLLPLAVTALVILVPIMGWRFHWPRSAADGSSLRVLTCNVEQDAVRPAALALLIEDERIDLVALQEVRSVNRFTWPQGWHVLVRDEFLLASRFPIMERESVSRPRNPFERAAVRFMLELPDRELQVFNLHLQSPRSGLEAVLNSKTLLDLSQVGRLDAGLKARAIESDRASQWIASYPGAKLVLGDFNTPVESVIYRHDWNQLANAFSRSGLGFGFTKVSEVRGWRYGTRIDHVLWSGEWRCWRCWVADEVGSDHLPLLAEFSLGAAPRSEPVPAAEN